MKNAFATPILVRLARRAGVKVNIEPRYEYAGQVVLRDGTKRYFRGTCFDLNPLGASEIAKDKDYSAYFLREMGYPALPGEVFFSPAWSEKIKSRRGIDAAYRYARHLGFPVIVKPNSLSQGSGVSKVHNKREFMQAVNAICKKDRVFLVQPVAEGRDYRVVVLDSEVMSAYERFPLTVLGDGRSTINQLLAQKQRLFRKTGRDTVIKELDFRITNHLKRLSLNRRSVPKKDMLVTLLDNRNLSSGGDAIDVTDRIHSTFRKLCIKITKDMGLRYCGVDLMVQGLISEPVSQYQIIEINAAPGIDNYANVGAKQRRIVEGMYLKVLKALAKV